VRPDQVTAWLTDARFDAYLGASDGDHGRAVAVYNWNAEISAAFMEVLYHLEVLLRNAIDRQFPEVPADRSLSICVADAWLCDPRLLTDESRERVNEAIQRLVLEQKKPTRGRVVASLSFGFWRALFSGRYEELWRSRLHGAFPMGMAAGPRSTVWPPRSFASGIASPITRRSSRWTSTSSSAANWSLPS